MVILPTQKCDAHNGHHTPEVFDKTLNDLYVTFSLLEEILENVCASCQDFLNCEVMLLGDTNIDFFNENGPLYNALSEFLKTFSQQLINEPTRISEHSQTAIDLVMVSDKCKILHSGVIVYGVSDHFLT